MVSTASDSLRFIPSLATKQLTHNSSGCCWQAIIHAIFISNALNNTSHLSSSPIDHQSWLREPVSRVSCMRVSFSRVSSRGKPLHTFITLIQVSSSSLEDCSVKTGRKSREDCAQVTSTAGTYVELMATSGGRMMVRSLESGFLHLKLNLFFFLFARRS